MCLGFYTSRQQFRPIQESRTSDFSFFVISGSVGLTSRPDSGCPINICYSYSESGRPIGADQFYRAIFREGGRHTAPSSSCSSSYSWSSPVNHFRSVVHRREHRPCESGLTLSESTERSLGKSPEVIVSPQISFHASKIPIPVEPASITLELLGINTS